MTVRKPILEAGQRIPNFRMMTLWELHGFALSGHELAEVASQILNIKLALYQVMDAEHILRDLPGVTTLEGLGEIRKRSEVYFRDMVARCGGFH